MESSGLPSLPYHRSPAAPDHSLGRSLSILVPGLDVSLPPPSGPLSALDSFHGVASRPPPAATPPAAEPAGLGSGCHSNPSGENGDATQHHAGVAAARSAVDEVLDDGAPPTGPTAPPVAQGPHGKGGGERRGKARWSREELQRLMDGLAMAGDDVARVARVVRTRSMFAVRKQMSHIAKRVGGPRVGHLAVVPPATAARLVLSHHRLACPAAGKDKAVGDTGREARRVLVRLVAAFSRCAEVVKGIGCNPCVEVVISERKRVWDIVSHLYGKWGHALCLQDAEAVTLPTGYTIRRLCEKYGVEEGGEIVVRLSYALLNVQIDYNAITASMKRRKRVVTGKDKEGNPIVELVPYKVVDKDWKAKGATDAGGKADIPPVVAGRPEAAAGGKNVHDDRVRGRPSGRVGNSPETSMHPTKCVAQRRITMPTSPDSAHTPRASPTVTQEQVSARAPDVITPASGNANPRTDDRIVPARPVGSPLLGQRMASPDLNKDNMSPSLDPVEAPLQSPSIPANRKRRYVPSPSELFGVSGASLLASPRKRVKPLFEERSTFTNLFQLSNHERSLGMKYEMPKTPKAAGPGPGDAPLRTIPPVVLDAAPRKDPGGSAGGFRGGHPRISSLAHLARDREADEDDNKIALATLRGTLKQGVPSEGGLARIGNSLSFPSLSNPFLGGLASVGDIGDESPHLLSQAAAPDMSRSRSGSGRSSRGSDLVGASTDNAMDLFAIEDRIAGPLAYPGKGGNESRGSIRNTRSRGLAGLAKDDSIDRILGGDCPPLSSTIRHSDMLPISLGDPCRSWSMLAPSRGVSRGWAADVGQSTGSRSHL